MDLSPPAVEILPLSSRTWQCILLNEDLGISIDQSLFNSNCDVQTGTLLAEPHIKFTLPHRPPLADGR